MVDENDLPTTQTPWPGSSELISREVVASCAGGEAFGPHLAWKAWSSGVTATERQAFIARATTYYRDHQDRMRYPEYRRRGLPLTSSMMESTIKQIHLRVKGIEKFRCRMSVETVFQLQARQPERLRAAGLVLALLVRPPTATARPPHDNCHGLRPDGSFLPGFLDEPRPSPSLPLALQRILVRRQR